MGKLIQRKTSSYVLCLERGTYRIDLQVGKVYKTVRRQKNDPPDMLRLIDDSGDDYLYPIDWFIPVTLPSRAKKAIASAGACA
jgi:hypothetical protein